MDEREPKSSPKRNRVNQKRNPPRSPRLPRLIRHARIREEQSAVEKNRRTRALARADRSPV